MPSNHCKELNKLQVKPVYLGRYRTIKKLIAGKEIDVHKRDRWGIGEIFSDRRGRRYQVQPNGALLHVV